MGTRGKNYESFRLPYVGERRSRCDPFIVTTPISPGPHVMSSEIGKGFTAPRSSGLTGASCNSGSKMQRPRILKRSRSSSNPPGNYGREQAAISQALRVLSLLREGGQP
jgi:hypothetical protein